MPGRLPHAIIYDWDNTLIDTFPLLFEVTNLTREKFGLTAFNDLEARRNIRRAAKDIMPIQYGERWQEAYDFFLTHMRARHLDNMMIMAGASDLVRYAGMRNIPQGVFSNKTNHLLRDEVAQFDLDGTISAIVGTGDYTGPGKPDPAGLLTALDQLGVESADYSNTWYVGDTENDLKTAIAAGVVPVFIENEAMSDAAEIAALQPRYSYKSCVEILAYLKTLS